MKGRKCLIITHALSSSGLFKMDKLYNLPNKFESNQFYEFWDTFSFLYHKTQENPIIMAQYNNHSVEKQWSITFNYTI